MTPRISVPVRSAHRFLAAAIVALVGSLTVIALSDDVADAADVIHVDGAGDDGASGASDDPVRTVARAVQLASDGDTVRIASGRYHESVQVYAKEVHLEAAPGAEVVFDGAVTVEGWTASGGRWWAPWTTSFERAGSPYTTADRPEAGWPEQFFLDGRQLAEVGSPAEVTSESFFHDRAADRVWIGADPTGRLVEGSALSWALYLNHADGSSISGVTVRRYATERRHMAAVRAYADDLTITDVTVADNAHHGLSTMGDRNTVDGVRSIDNGHIGVHAHRATDLTFRRLTLVGNNRAGFDPFHEAGGMKVTESTGVVVESSIVTDNDGPGIWLDLDVTAAIVRSNHSAGNGRSGIEVEISRDVVVVDNTVVDNGEAGVWVLESSDVDVWHNAAFGNVRDVWVEDGPRRDLVDVRVMNNLLGGAPVGTEAIFSVDDWTEQRSAADMRVSENANRYWITPSNPATLVSRWANWPQPLGLSATIEQHRAATGQGQDSDLVVAGVNPFVRSAEDLRQPAGAPLGVALTDRVAAAADRAVDRLPAGPFDAGPASGPNGGPPPSTPPAPSTTAPPSTDPVQSEPGPPAAPPTSGDTATDEIASAFDAGGRAVRTGSHHGWSALAREIGGQLASAR